MTEEEYMNFVLLQSIETNEEEELIRLGLLTEKTTKPILLIDSNIPMASTSKLESNSSNKNITGNRKVWPKSNLIEKIKFDINTGLDLLEVQLLENVNPGYCCISDLGKPSEWGKSQGITSSHDDNSTSSKGKGRERVEVIPIRMFYFTFVYFFLHHDYVSLIFFEFFQLTSNCSYEISRWSNKNYSYSW